MSLNALWKNSASLTTSLMAETRAHLHYGICRHCFGTGEVATDAARVACPECLGEGAQR